jgi:hypothetical protein
MARRGGGRERSRRRHAANATPGTLSGALVRDALEKGNAPTFAAFSRPRGL